MLTEMNDNGLVDVCSCAIGVMIVMPGSQIKP
jgi:hypothetical protein